MPLSAGPVELLPQDGWRLVIHFQAGRSWCGWLYDPTGEQRATWIGKRTSDDLAESAVGFVCVMGRPEEAHALRRHWEAVR